MVDSNNSESNIVSAKNIEELKAITDAFSMSGYISKSLWIALKKIPLLGDTLDVLEPLFQGIAAMEKDQRRKRINDYVFGIAHINRGEIDITKEDFLAVLKKLLQDDETAKTEYYARLTVSLAESSLDTGMKIYFLRMVSELTCAQILYAREFVIRKTIPLCGFLTTDEAERDLTSSDSGIDLRGLNTLKNWGLLKEAQEPPKAKVSVGPLYDITDDLTVLMSFLFHPDEMKADVINKEAKADSDVIIINHYCSVNDLYVNHLQSVLSKAGLTVSVVERNDNYRKEKTARCYIYNNAMSKGRSHKEYINIFVLQKPDPNDSPINLSSPDRSFEIDREIFMGTGNAAEKDALLLCETLDQVAEYVLKLVH